MDGLRRVVVLRVSTFAELTGYAFYISILFFFLLVERATLSYDAKVFCNGCGWLFHEIVKLIYTHEFLRIFKCTFLINVLSITIVLLCLVL